MITFGVALSSALVFSLVFTPILIRILVARNYGQFIRKDGPTSHYTKRGTPTMGGLVIIASTVFGWAMAMIVGGIVPSASALLLLFVFAGAGLIGFVDDFIKISKQRSLGLSPTAKMIGQISLGTVFALLVVLFPNEHDITPGTTAVSIIRDTSLDFRQWGLITGFILIVIWLNFLIASWTNAVNITDGLDGLSVGASLFAFGAYAMVCVWQWYQQCGHTVSNGCYEVRDPRDLALIAAAIVGACFGFLWWNTSPAQIFMGDTGSLALGGAFAGLSVLTHTEFLAVIIGGLFVVVVASTAIQVSVFKLTKKRVFRMAPLHHHFELKGWPEVTIVVRFWIIAGLFAIVGLALFYGEWVVKAL